MITSSFIVSLLVFLIIIALVYWAINQLDLPQPVRGVAIVIVVVAAVLYLLKFVGTTF